MKGTALSRTIYMDPFTRPGSDIDILVKPKDVRRARKALEIAGYRCHYPYFEVSSSFFCEEEFALVTKAPDISRSSCTGICPR